MGFLALLYYLIKNENKFGMVVKITPNMVSQTVIKALNNIQAQLIKIAGLSEDQLGKIQAIITKNTQPKIKGMGKKTGYILFSMTERKRLKEAGELEGMAFGDIARLLGKNWRESDQGIKDEWNTEAKDHNQSLVPAKPEIQESESESEIQEQPKRGRKPKSKPVDSDSDSEEIKKPKRGRKPKSKKQRD